jgi:molybdopterin-guanine dinucleotide biosynthesis protein A
MNSSILPADVTGVILAGGLATRMGGVDKGLQSFDGRMLVEHVIERLAPQVGSLLINANRNRDRYAAFGHRIISDRITGHPGPLAGLHAALMAAETPWVVSVPCDSPRLPTDLVSRMSGALARNNAPLAIAQAAGREHPVFCLCRSSLAVQLGEFIESGGRKVLQWCRDNKALIVEFPDESAFGNFNTLNDLKENQR